MKRYSLRLRTRFCLPKLSSLFFVGSFTVIRLCPGQKAKKTAELSFLSSYAVKISAYFLRPLIAITAARRLRPLRRRRLIKSWPDLVAIRARNPWVLKRLTLLGWNVLFIILRSYLFAYLPKSRRSKCRGSGFASSPHKSQEKALFGRIYYDNPLPSFKRFRHFQAPSESNC